MTIAWGITGAGHFLRECVDLILELDDVDVFLSRAAEEVLQMYRLKDDLDQATRVVTRDRTASAPVVGRFSRVGIQVLVIAPATSNSVAKFVLGISDSLITNLFAHAGKNRIPRLGTIAKSTVECRRNAGARQSRLSGHRGQTYAKIASPLHVVTI